MGDWWHAAKPCERCAGRVRCERWGGNDIRIACTSCGHSFTVQEGLDTRHFYEM